MFCSLCSGVHSSCGVLNDLHLFNAPLGESSQKSITVVESTGNESMNKLLLVFYRHESLNSGHGFKMTEGCFGH